MFAVVMCLAVLMPSGSEAAQLDAGDGSLDVSFGSGGVAATVNTARSAAIQPDGKLVVAGAQLARHHVDGSLDQAFGVGGVTPNLGGGIVLLQPDLRILVAGAALARYQADGSLDVGFGAGGRVDTALTAIGMALQRNGKILLVGSGTLTRYNADGSLDSSFGVGGTVARSGLSALAIQADGKILVAGAGLAPNALRLDFMLLRYNEDGTSDRGFGTAGVVYTDFGGRIDRANDLVIQPDGKILLAGEVGDNRVNTPWDFGLARYNEDGTLDGTFGGAGRVRTIIGAFSRIRSVTLQSDGKIVAAGETQTVGPAVFLDLAVVRYHSDGTLDDRFGAGGTVTTRLPLGSGSASDVAIQRDGRIVAVSNLGLVRYRHDSMRGPFGGSRRVFPGLIEAEDYDLGGPGIGYFDTTPGSEQYPIAYRSDDVDIKPSREGGHTIGWFAAGEWLTYTGDVAADGLFTIRARVGTALPGRSFHVELDGGDVSGVIAVPQFADWDHYDTVTIANVALSAGRHVLRVVMGSESFMDLQWIAVSRQDTGPLGGVPHLLPGRIEAEDYDLGGQGIGYFDTTPGNEQGVAPYRSDDVDIKVSAEGGYTIGWLAAGEWLAYTAQVQRDGLYAIQARVGSALPGRTFHLEIDGCDVTGPIAVTQVADWDTYQTVTVAGVPLRAGPQALRVVMGPESFMDLQWIAVVQSPTRSVASR